MTYPSPYHQTATMTGEQVRDAIRAAKAQDAAVLAVFANGLSLSPSMAHGIVTIAGKKWPLTSVRRAITNLENDGLLVKLSVTRIGPFGRPEHLWERAP